MPTGRYSTIKPDTVESARYIGGWLPPGNNSGDPKRLYPFLLLGREIPPRLFQVVMALKVHPKLRAITEVQTQAKGGVSRDAPPIVDDLGDSIG